MTKDYWIKVVLRLLKPELVKRDLTYADLSERLATMGVKINEDSIRNKFSRGTFSAVFLIQCLKAIGVENIRLDEALFKDVEKRKK